MSSFVSQPYGTLPTAASLEASGPTQLPADSDVPICLDFLKGRCSRKRCRFLHPDLSQYQQLSGAVRAQAGRQICEVWAMTGTCKFGAKCSRLHPVVLNQPSQPVLTFYLPVGVAPQLVFAAPSGPSGSPAAAAAISVPLCQEWVASSTLPVNPHSPSKAPRHAVAPAAPSPLTTVSPRGPLLPPAPQPMSPASKNCRKMTVTPVAPPAKTSAPAAPLAAPTAPLRPQHVSPPGLLHSTGNPQTELQDLALSILATLEAGKKEARTIPPISKGQPQVVPRTERGRGRSLACLFGDDDASERPPIHLPSPTRQSPRVSKSPRKPQHPQHDKGRALDMLRDLHNAFQ